MRWPPKECICSPPPPLPLCYLIHISSSAFSSCLLLFLNLFPCFLWPLTPPLFSHHLFFLPFSSFYSSPSLSLCAPFPSTHQSLALASPLRTYGMMDHRASGASKAKGHLPGALHCRGALGPAMQPRPHTSVSRHSRLHTQHAHSNTYYRIGYLTLAPLTLIAASRHVWGFVFLMI